MYVPAEVHVFAGEIRSALKASSILVGGSIATGDYRPGISDMDLVAVVPDPLDATRQRHVARLHRSFIRKLPTARKLHCVYVPASEVDDIALSHPTWTSGRLVQRPLSGIARAELNQFGFAIVGAAPRTVLPPMSIAAVHQAVRDELSGYWTTAIGWRTMWLRDSFVDLGLLTMARADAELRECELITKSAALDRLALLDVPAWLVEGIVRRRRGHRTAVGIARRVRRAQLVRNLVALSIDRLLAL